MWKRFRLQETNNNNKKQMTIINTGYQDDRDLSGRAMQNSAPSYLFKCDVFIDRCSCLWKELQSTALETLEELLYKRGADLSPHFGLLPALKAGLDLTANISEMFVNHPNMLMKCIK